jgi:hypothetical protein
MIESGAKAKVLISGQISCSARLRVTSTKWNIAIWHWDSKSLHNPMFHTQQRYTESQGKWNLLPNGQETPKSVECQIVVNAKVKLLVIPGESYSV